MISHTKILNFEVLYVGGLITEVGSKQPNNQLQLS